jgi:hypothetical protein
MNKLCFVAILVISHFVVNGQNARDQLVIQGGTGASLMGTLASVSNLVTSDAGVQSSTTLPVVGAIDYGVTKNFSIGIGGGMQTIKQKYTDYSYVNDQGNTVVESFEYKATRTNIGLRLGVHGGPNPKVDLYCGLKVGLSFWNISANTSNNSLLLQFNKASALAVQFIPIGVRVYPAKNFGFFVETGIGAPTYLSGGIALRFGKSGENKEEGTK